MPDILQMGPFSIQAKLLMIFVAGVAAYYTMKLRMKQLSVSDGSQLLDAFMNAAWIIILFWKFGPVMQQPQWIWEEPLLILLATGGETFLIIGLIAALIYLYIWSRTKRVSMLFAADTAVYGLLVFWVVMKAPFWDYGSETNLPWGIQVTDQGMRYHPLNVYFAVLVIAAIIYVWKTKLAMGSGKHTARFLLSYGVVGMLMTLFDVQFVKNEFIFSSLQWWYVACMLLGYIWSYTDIISRKGDEHR